MHNDQILQSVTSIVCTALSKHSSISINDIRNAVKASRPSPLTVTHKDGARGMSTDQSNPIRVAVMSDLHLEFEGTNPNPGPDLAPLKGNIDLLLLAGDIDLEDRPIAYASQLCEQLQCEVVLISGNHEFYYTDRVRTLATIRRTAQRSPIHFLENNAVYLRVNNRDIRILGCTLWTDYCLHGGASQAPTVMAEVGEMLNDHFIIHEGPTATFSPDDALRLHKESREWLEKELGNKYDGITIVMTHHAPSKRSVPDRFRDDLLTPAFASDLDCLVKKSDARLWVHGHTHDSFDYTIGKTRVVCNPRGYVGRELNISFKTTYILLI